MFSIGLNSVCRPMIVFLFRLISLGRNIYHSQPASFNHPGPGALEKYQIQILRALTPSRQIQFWSIPGK